MFVGLPVITETLVKEAADKEWPYFLDLMIKCMKETSTLDQAIDCACGELKTQNPKRSGAATAVVPSVLVILNLISKSLRDWQVYRGETK